MQVIGFSLFLMDTEAPKESGEHKSAVTAVNINKMDRKGTISLAKYDHILKVCALLPSLLSAFSTALLEEQCTSNGLVLVCTVLLNSGYTGGHRHVCSNKRW